MMALYALPRVVSLMLCLALFTPTHLRAQDQKLSEILPNLYTDSVLSSAFSVAQVLRTDPVATLASVQGQLVDQLVSAFAMNTLIGAQASSFPLGSSAGGFTWTFDPALGTFNRVSSSFGPVFADRALTTGRRRFNFGINYQRATFDSVEGVDLDERAITTYTGFPIATSVGGFQVIFEDALNLSLTTDTVGLFANYGVTERLDVGVAVPIMRVGMEASLNSRIAVVSGFSTRVESSDFGEVLEGTPVNTSASGIGDIVVRGKYNFLRTAGGGLAGAVDLRLPTGDEENFLGVGGPQARFQIIGSTTFGRLSPHVNLGFTKSGESDVAKDPNTFIVAPPDELNFAGGVDVWITPKVTVVGDIVSRTLRDTIRLELAPPTHFATSLRQFSFRGANLTNVLGSAGIKFNPMGQALISFNVLFPLNDAGLVDNLTWLGGAEISF